LGGVILMPMFEYICQECDHRFEIIVKGSTVPACPACKAIKVEKQFSAFGVGGTDSWPSSGTAACGSCGDPRGPGACSMN
jgi:putative FmdB family regulatory protein